MKNICKTCGFRVNATPVKRKQNVKLLKMKIGVIGSIRSFLQNTFAVADAEELLPVLNKTLMSLLILILAGVFVAAQIQ